MRQPPGRAAVFAIFHFVGADALIGPSTPQRESPLYKEAGKIANGDQGGEENSPVMLRMTTPSS